MVKAKINIEGMHCASCAANVEKSLKKIPGVRDVKANAIMGKAIAEVETSVTKEQLKEAVKDAGYDAKEIAIS